MSFFGKKSSKNDTSGKMRTLKVEFNTPQKALKSRGKKSVKPMNFTEWIDHYVEMSKGNPV